MKIGTVTVGQSPRSDVIPELRAVLGADIRIVEKGALDGLDSAEIRTLRPEPNQQFLVTRLKEGGEVQIAKKHAGHRVQKCISELEADSVDLIILLCTGEFPEIRSTKTLLRPNAIITQVVLSLMETGKLGVVVPSPDQIPHMKSKWEDTHLDLIMEGVSPYSGTAREIEAKAEIMKRADVDLILLDCIGFSRETKRIFREVTRKPVLLPVTLLGRIALSLLGEPSVDKQTF